MTEDDTHSGPRALARVELLRDLDRPTGRVLLVDGVEQSYVDVDPTHLEFEYMQHMALALDAIRVDRAPIRAVHLGGGAFTMPRWVAATRPGSEQVAIESADAVLGIAAGLAPVGCEVVVGDALTAIDELPADSADLVIWDLYDGPRAVTAALTLEAIRAQRRLLVDAGVILLNVSDAAPFDVVRPVLAALRTCFADVALLAEPSTLRGRRSGNCVLVGTVSGGLPNADLTRAGAAAPVRASVVAGADLAALVGVAVPATRDAPLPPPSRRRGRAFL